MIHFQASRLAVQCRCMVKAIGAPHLQLFMPGFRYIGKRGDKQEFEHSEVIGRPLSRIGFVL